jgi:hypothetical protein
MFLVTGLKASDCASWVQAWFTLLAAIIAIVGVWFSLRGQAKLIHSQIEAQRLADISARAEAFSEVINRALVMITTLIQEADCRDKFINSANINPPGVMRELLALQAVFDHFPLHEMPPVLLSTALLSSSCLRQFIITFDSAVREARQMDAQSFDAFHNEVMEIRQALFELSAQLDYRINKKYPSKNQY